MSLKQWDKPTRWLHLAMASTVSIQLFASIWMHRPKPGRVVSLFESSLYYTHIYCGLTAFGIVMLHWAWMLYARNKTLSHVFPYTQQARRHIWDDIKNLLRFTLPKTGPHGGLPGFIQGLGFLCVTAMASTGFLMYTFHLGKPQHKFISTFVWIYWCAHVAMGVLHQVFSSRRQSLLSTHK